MSNKIVDYFNNIQTAIDETSPDGVIIATPNHLYAEHAQICCVIGSHIAAIAYNLASAKKISNCSAEYSTPVLVVIIVPTTKEFKIKANIGDGDFRRNSNFCWNGNIF